jgi:hypothetical protein
VLPEELPDMIDYTSHREFVRKVLDREVDYTARDPPHTVTISTGVDLSAAWLRKTTSGDPEPS